MTMSVVEGIQVGSRLVDKRMGRERQVRAVERLGRVINIWFDDAKTGGLEAFVYPVSEAEERFEVLAGGTAAFRANCEIVRSVAEAHRLAHAYLFNSAFATETSLIDPLPHQLIAVYDKLLRLPRLRFLLADDAGAGKTIMAGLYIREMLLRRLVERILIVPPAGLVGNWERELRNLFRLKFRILMSADGARENPFDDPRNNMAIVSIDTLARGRMRGHMREARAYDLVVFDEAHKLSATRDADLTVDASKRYELAAEIAAQGRHLLLLTATPHMGKDDPYYFLWRLLDPELLSTPEAFNRLSREKRSGYCLRRMKEEMVRFDGTPIYPPRESMTVEYPLTVDERELYDSTTKYCEVHCNRAKQRNRGAAGLAMSVLQRRLASSTWALLKSLERRDAKLSEELRLLEQGLLSEKELEERQRQLPLEDIRDTKTGDEEEAEDGREESERNDDEIVSATDAVSPEELRTEIEEVRRLVILARNVYEAKHESKFERVWEALKAQPETKVLIFTEHRDTMSFLIGRLEGLGLAGKIACIHGGMDYKERDQAAEFFRDPNGARYLVATDAAGEGINLQFCWLLVNYDIPWNPARIEQRMGRVHRYKQQHDVLLLNLVAAETREGRVLKVLLDKLERIRKELGTDKVFDVIGQQFGDVSLPDLLFRAVVEGRDAEVARTIDTTLTRERVEKQLAEQRKRVECSEVRKLLASLKERQEQAALRRMMPAYVRGYFEKATALAGITIAGDIDGVWRLGTTPNLTHMHVRALEQISAKPELIADELRARIRAARLGDVEDGVVPHNLPDGPKDIGDTPDLHFVVLPPECVVELGKPVPAAVEAYFNTTSGPKNPRTYRNAVVALAPDRAKLAGLRERVMRLLGWRAVEAGEEAKLLSDVQKKELTRRKREAEDGLADAVRAAYSVLLAVDEGGAVEARPLPPGAEGAFARARKALIEAERLLATSLDPELFLPGSYLDLWGSAEKAKKAKDLVAAFGQLPRLPRLLKPQVLQDSLARGIREGKIVLQFVCADGSARTLWRVEAPSEDLSRPEAEVVPTAFAGLHELEPDLLVPGRIEGLWLTDTAPLSMERIESLFDGVRCPRVASPEVIDRAVRAAVQRGLLMARTDGKVFLHQALPDRPVPHDLELLLPPPPVRGADLGPKELPEAWKDGKTNLATVAQAVSRRRGHGVPWILLRDGVTEALAARLFEVVEDGTWPCGPDDAERVRFRIVEIVELEPEGDRPAADTLAKLNEMLARVSSKWRLE
ncbi:MAG: DEAD/DEAH box helicase [Deltaproteobacteria bacterium]|nr:DEAD/DEAH box helicase [Deltaproteobacteria bacterium]